MPSSWPLVFSGLTGSSFENSAQPVSWFSLGAGGAIRF